MSRFIAFGRNHKILTFFVVLIIVGLGYGITQAVAGKKSAATEYVLSSVTKGALITTISGSGQVSASNQVDIKPKASGDVIAVRVQSGQEVKSGMVIAQLDASNAYKSVRDAQANLESAKISLAKIQKPTDALTLTQAQNSLARAEESKQSAQDDLTKNYADGFNDVANAFLQLPNIMTGLQDMFYSSASALGNGGQWNVDYYTDAVSKYDMKIYTLHDDFAAKYSKARTSYEQALNDYKAANRNSDSNTIENLIIETNDTVKDISETVKSATNLIQLYQDTLSKMNIPSAPQSNTQLTTLNDYIGKTNSHLSTLLSATSGITSAKQTITNSTRTIDEATQSLAKLQAGTDQLDLQSAQLSVKQRENALLDAQQTLGDYTVRAPFDGTIAKVDVKKGDNASSGTALATLVTKQKIATLSLNEVDVAKVSVGQKATLTFDAVPDLTISGVVASIDTIGTVTQGVVEYSMSIAFDTQDDRIKPGMTVSAAIITNAKQDVLQVPNSAIKSQNNASYVEVLDNPGVQGSQGVTSATTPRQISVQIGIANDTATEIISGLTENQQIVIRTISTSAKSTTTSAPSLFGTSGNRGTTGTTRIPAR